jgi:hypothetical protein
MRTLTTFAIVPFLFVSAQRVDAGAVIASGDEWILTDFAYRSNNDSTTAFANNLVAYLGGTDYLVSAATPQIYGNSFQAQLASCGITVTTEPSAVLSPEFLSQFDAVFLAGAGGSGAENAPTLNEYLENGGSVFLCLGTGTSGRPASEEAAAWNPFLGHWGLMAGSAWFDPEQQPLLLVPGNHPLQVNVTEVAWSYGQEIDLLDLPNPHAQIAFTGVFGGSIGNKGILGVASVPEPSGFALLGVGALALLARVCRRRKRAA